MALTLLLVTQSALAQGTLIFRNFGIFHPETGAFYDAPVFNVTGAPIGPTFSGGLYLLNGGSESLLAVTPFRVSDIRPGTLNPIDVIVPGIPAGQPATFRVKVWEAAAGSYEQAVAGGFCTGIFPTLSGNNEVTTVLTSPFDPVGPAAVLNGLLPFTLDCIPEPTVSALLLLGAALLFRRRSNRSNLS